MKKCTANMTAICRRLKRMRELKKLPLEEQRKKLKRVRPIKPYHKAKKGTAKKYAGILKMPDYDYEWNKNYLYAVKKKGVDLHLTRKDAQQLFKLLEHQIHVTYLDYDKQQKQKAFWNWHKRILNKLKREGIK